VLVGAPGTQAGSALLPAAPTYVDSFGPLYRELGLNISPQPQTERAATRAINQETVAGLSPATLGTCPRREYFGFTAPSR